MSLVKMKLKKNLILIIIYAITGALVFIHHSSLSIITNCLVFFTLVGSFSEANSSTYIKWLNGIYTSISGVFHRHIDVENDYKSKALSLQVVFIPMRLAWTKNFS